MIRSLSASLVFTVAILAGTAALGGLAGTIFDNYNNGTITNWFKVEGAAKPPSFAVDEPVHITQIATHHWGDTSGTITLACPPAGTYGPYQAKVVNPQKSFGETYGDLEANVNITITTKVTCTVKDSKPDSWAYNSISGGYGFTRVFATTLTGGAVAVKPTPTPLPKPGAVPAMGGIIAEYNAAQHFTEYSIDDKPLLGGAKYFVPVTYRWLLSFECVDPGCPKSPGPRVDSSCKNRGVKSSETATLIWHHGDTEQDGLCDHSKVGPSGHQGQITLVVATVEWTCTAYYNGTNAGKGPAPVCKKRQ